MPKVSIGVPVYNGGRFIAETLDSLLAQTYEDYELVISDNASTDDTEHICRAYAAKDKRIRYERNAENLGASKNYQRVFELTSGEYFRWANCDDLFAPESLARCVEVLEQEPTVVLVYPKTKLIDSEGQFISDFEDEYDFRSPRASERFAQFFNKQGLMNIIYGLIRADALKHTKFLRNFPGGDLPLVAELTLYGKFWEIPERLFYRRMHPEASHGYKDDVSRTQEFFDPATKGKLPMREWKHLIAHSGSVWRAPVDLVEKTRMTGCLLKNAVRIRDRLGREVVQAVRYAGHKISS